MQITDKKQWIWFYAIGIGLLMLVLFQLLGVHQPLKMMVLDVGQGDAILIQTPAYQNILVDAGADSIVVDGLGEKMGFFDKEIDLFVLTHPHRDHYGGILDVMKQYKVKKVLMTGVKSGDPVYLAFLDVIRQQDVEILFNQSHQDIQISPNVYLDILYPFQDEGLLGQEVHNKNNTSIVARLVRRTNGGWEALAMLTGDAEAEEETEILLSGQDVRSDILKLGHHGSKTATSNAFLAAVSPSTAIVSAGKDNKFDHPHAETMEKVKDLTIFQTMNGSVEFNF